jgi:hypothetical protein
MLSMLESVLGRWDDYERHIEAATEMNQRTGGITWQLLLRGQMGIDLIRRGRPGDAARGQELIDSAVSDGEAAGIGLSKLIGPLIEQLKAT